MIDPTALKTELLNLLDETIGSYTFTAGTTPAIRIDDGSAPYPEQPIVTGLEVVIRPETEINLTPMLAGDRSVALRSEVVLKQWNLDETTRDARDILIARLSGLEEVGAIVPRNTVLDTIESCTLFVGDGFHCFG